ncbi:N-succinylarginine dihydrolase [Sphingomonas astaxanthinifaciens]|uniref:N-succinylarginine dihydrolase n=1 Tax=Sphingomonas astaxanthinifaciens DSM 22298 TaxID=1123267 RepID=A0ABQ5Z315_9SPHN|nr:N-succinylarginine dihydrolase [Sphingomonas astaxanthinifaciens]GLR46395.1 N-succinylarginine dihydrolase [Sphingomonas astaxanthinifaciens DSM 22298]
MSLVEINFDGIVGPSHNYGGLSLGNLASARNFGAVSKPRAAALQGLEKMRSNLRLGLPQGIFMPQPRPARAWLAELGTTPEEASPALLANAMSASAMWAANAATVSPAPDTADGRTHLTVANLRTMVHRSHEWHATLAQLRVAFAADAYRVHGPVPPTFGDEGAANHMRLCARHGEPGVEVFVFGIAGGPFPARQHVEAGRAIARLHGLDPERTLFVQQSEEAIAAGAFHNDVVAVANERVLFAHELAFADKEAFLASLETRFPELDYVEVSAAEVSLEDAIRSYLFNAQLVTPPDGRTTLVVPEEARETPAVWDWLQRHLAGNGAIRDVRVVDVRQSMANGGGPACLRLRVVCDPATVDPRFLVDEAKLDRLGEVIARTWPEEIAVEDLGSASLIRDIEAARAALLEACGLGELA